MLHTTGLILPLACTHIIADRGPIRSEPAVPIITVPSPRAVARYARVGMPDLNNFEMILSMYEL